MTKQEYLDGIKAMKVRNAEILDTIEARENKKATNIEALELETNKAEIAEFERQIKTIDEGNKHKFTPVENVINENEFTLTSFLRNLKSNSFSDVEKNVINIGKEQFNRCSINYTGVPLPLNFKRATLAAGTTGVGKELVPTEKYDLVMPLRANLVLAKAGATILTGLQGNISIPVMTGSTAGWKGETEAAGDGNNGFTTVEFSPLRLTVKLPVSNLLLTQSSADVEAKLQQDLANAISDKLESTLLGAVSAATGVRPAGIFYGASYSNGGVQVTGTTTWDKVVALETGVKSLNSTGNIYLVHPNTMGKFKTTPKATNQAIFIAENSLINGYPFLTTTNMPTISTGKGILFGNFKDYYILFWSAMDVVADNVTLADQGMTRYIINVYVNAGAVQPKSFAKGWLS